MTTKGLRKAPVQQGGLVPFVNMELLPLLQQMLDQMQSLLVPTVETAEADLTLEVGTDLALVDASDGAVTVTLASAASRRRPVRVVKTDSSGNAVTVSPVSGGASLAAQWDSVTVLSDGTLYYP